MDQTNNQRNRGQDKLAFLHFPMILLSSLGLLRLLSLYVGLLLSADASLACTHPPCRESLVAAPNQPGSSAGLGPRACEGQTGSTACRNGVTLLAMSDVPRRVEHRHNFPQVQPKVSGITFRVCWAVMCCSCNPYSKKIQINCLIYI